MFIDSFESCLAPVVSVCKWLKPGTEDFFGMVVKSRPPNCGRGKESLPYTLLSSMTTSEGLRLARTSSRFSLFRCSISSCCMNCLFLSSSIRLSIRAAFSCTSFR